MYYVWLDEQRHINIIKFTMDSSQMQTEDYESQITHKYKNPRHSATLQPTMHYAASLPGKFISHERARSELSEHGTCENRGTEKGTQSSRPSRPIALQKASPSDIRDHYSVSPAFRHSRQPETEISKALANIKLQELAQKKPGPRERRNEQVTTPVPKARHTVRQGPSAYREENEQVTTAVPKSRHTVRQGPSAYKEENEHVTTVVPKSRHAVHQGPSAHREERCAMPVKKVMQNVRQVPIKPVEYDITERLPSTKQSAADDEFEVHVEPSYLESEMLRLKIFVIEFHKGRCMPNSSDCVWKLARQWLIYKTKTTFTPSEKAAEDFNVFPIQIRLWVDVKGSEANRYDTSVLQTIWSCQAEPEVVITNEAQQNQTLKFILDQVRRNIQQNAHPMYSLDRDNIVFDLTIRMQAIKRTCPPNTTMLMMQ